MATYMARSGAFPWLSPVRFPRSPNVLAATLAVALVALSGAAHAQEDAEARAEVLDSKAAEFAAKNDVRNALKTYSEALSTSESPKRVCNVGAAHYQLNEWAQAHFFLGQCLSFAGHIPAAAVEQYSTAFAYADQQLRAGGYVRVQISPTPKRVQVRIALPTLSQVARFSGPRTVWLPLGKHQLEASAPGHKALTKSFSVTAKADGAPQSVEVPLSPESAAPEIVAPQPPTSPEPKAPLVAPTGEPESHAQDSNLAAWVSLAGGVGLSAVGGVFHLRASGVRGDLEATPSGDIRRSLISDLKRERLIMAGFYGVGLTAIGIGTFLITRGGSQESEGSKLSVQIGAGSLGLRGSF